MKPTLVKIEGNLVHRYVDGKFDSSAQITSDNAVNLRRDIEWFRANGLPESNEGEEDAG